MYNNQSIETTFQGCRKVYKINEFHQSSHFETFIFFKLLKYLNTVFETQTKIEFMIGM